MVQVKELLDLEKKLRELAYKLQTEYTKTESYYIADKEVLNNVLHDIDTTVDAFRKLLYENRSLVGEYMYTILNKISRIELEMTYLNNIREPKQYLLTMRNLDEYVRKIRRYVDELSRRLDSY